MPDPLNIVNVASEAIGKVTDVVDDNVYSRQESESDRTARHIADMQSDNKFAKAIRPLITAWAMAINTVLWVWGLASPYKPDSTVLLTAGGVLTAAIAFYFESRRGEKINAKRAAVEIKKAEAAVKIEEMKARQAFREDRRESRRNAREARRQARRNR